MRANTYTVHYEGIAADAIGTASELYRFDQKSHNPSSLARNEWHALPYTLKFSDCVSLCS